MSRPAFLKTDKDAALVSFSNIRLKKLFFSAEYPFSISMGDMGGKSNLMHNAT